MDLLLYPNRRGKIPANLLIEYPMVIEGYPSLPPGEVIYNEVSENYSAFLSKPLPLKTEETFRNEIENGNFEGGYAPWWNLYGSANLSAAGNVLSIEGDGSSRYVGVAQDDNLFPIMPGQKVYIQAKVKVLNSNCQILEVFLTSSEHYFDPAGYTGIIYNPVMNEEYLISTIYTIPAEFGGNLVLGFQATYPDALTAAGEFFEVQDVILVDMGTDNINQLYHLNEGKEYNLEWLFSEFFDGEKLFKASDVRTSNKDILFQNGYAATGDTGNEIKTIQLLFKNEVAINKDSDLQGLIQSAAGKGISFGGIAANQIISIGGIADNFSSWEDEFKTILPGWHTLALVWNGAYYDIWLDRQKKPVEITGVPAILNFSDFEMARIGENYFNGRLGYLMLYTDSKTPREIEQNRVYMLSQQARKGLFPLIGNTYFVANAGDDLNDGLSISTPWKTIAKVNGEVLAPGDIVKFKRSNTWRENLECQSGNYKGHIKYTDYGWGDKPKILGSLSKNDAGDWTDEGGNIWATAAASDVGSIILDAGAAAGFKKATEIELIAQNDFWSDTVNDLLKIYSTGNPAGLYDSIELARNENIVKVYNVSCIDIENIDLFYGGAHGIGCTNVHDINIKNCEIGWMGGGYLTGVLRYGNGVEFFDYCTNLLITGCDIHDIFDAGITIQGHGYGITYRDIFIRGNVINNTEWSLEFWNMGYGGNSKNINFINNVCYGAGVNWGTPQRPDPGGIHVNLNENTAATDGIFIKGNVFDYAVTPIIYVAAGFVGIETIIFEDNVYRWPAADPSFFGYDGVNYFNLEDFQVGTGQDSGSTLEIY